MWGGGGGGKEGVSDLQGDPSYHVQRVDDVAKRLAHLATVSVPYHGVQVHLGEGEAPHQLLAKEHHPSHPEEDDVVARL